MTNEIFRIGDVVQLNSDGPEMTINKFVSADPGKEQSEIVECVWFDKGDNLHRADFNVHALEILT